AGSVTFTSSDSLATKPPDVTFNGTQGGSVTISARFVSLGVQSLTASQIGDATITGSATTNVHGFVYADPPAGAKVRLVLNAANRLLTGVSQKASGAGVKTTDTTLTVGAVMYSVRLGLAPTATTGTIFDGNALPAGYRAAVRDRLGKDVAEMADFAIGQLAVR